ncbi:protein SPA1-RELATED 4-like isoform X1 [Hordeum vulgare subsp. vulgare]|uniref:Protein kinase domain-containing protein n=1 Tax=Hordeum vulgare subsp. vulgare TaxID=112509 RepID=A0A8I6WT72_HORVV|nr:protein SPA1-RELATED 4-like isoform X1 [Hordeum vulgare subsp. vulgare]
MEVSRGGGARRGEEEEEGGEVSLREWLDRPARAVEAPECLHVFRQVAEAVADAHAQGVAVGSARPSCFVVSPPFARVAFIESASGSDASGSDASEDADHDAEPPRQGDGAGRAGEDRSEKGFPLKSVLAMELNWYTSPEEADDSGGGATFASDVYRLGVLLFELFCSFETLEEKMRAMANLRYRVLPPQLLLKWPKEASFCQLMMHPVPDTRPKMSEVLQSEFLNQSRNSLEEHDAALRLREDIEEQELLLDFLLQLQKRKQDVADNLQDTVAFLSSDINEVLHQQSALGQCGNFSVELDKEVSSGTVEDQSDCGSRKRFRPELHAVDMEEHSHSLEECSRTVPSSVLIQESVLSKSSRLMKNFKKLETAYFQTRSKLARQVGNPLSSRDQVVKSTTGSAVGTEGSSIDDFALEGHSGRRHRGWMNSFLEGLCRYLSFSQLKVRAELKQCDLLNSSNLVCSVGFDRDKEFFATAGVNKKIKVFEYNMIVNEHRDIHYPVVEMSNKSKLSCISWNSYMKSHIASSDFDGLVQVWDVTRSQVFVEMREHERRVWSVDFSLADPTKLVSGSDDGTVKLWSMNQAGSVGTIRTRANVCSVQFQPDSARSIAIGSADHKIYCYDLRNVRAPYCTLVGHTKTVSYVKYVDASTIVSGSTDNSLKLWDLSMNQARVIDNPIQTFTGHTNTKNFVGLSISDGYIATGSETNEVFVYHKAFPMPVLAYKFNVTDPISGQEIDDQSQFISCVCWRGQSSTLLSANSSGNIKVLEMD